MPRSVDHLTAADVRRRAWKNGRGVTEELALWPPGSAIESGQFEYRISRANVEEPGPFSSFPGFERILVVTTGDGLVLEHGDCARRARLRRFEPYRFSGDWPTRADLANGPVADFNVLVRRERFDADVQVSKLGRRRARETLERGHAFVHVLAGGAVARITGEEESFVLGSGESLWARDLLADDELDLASKSDDCVVLLVRIRPARSAEE